MAHIGVVGVIYQRHGESNGHDMNITSELDWDLWSLGSRGVYF